MDESALGQIYERLVDLLSSYLLSTSSPHESISVEELTADEDFDISFVTAIEFTILGHFQQSHIHDKLIIRLLEILKEGANQQVDLKSSNRMVQSRADSNPNTIAANSEELSVSPTELKQSFTPPCNSPPSEEFVDRERFATSCVLTLFNVCSINTNFERVSRLAAPILISHCKSVIVRYVEERKLHKSFPMPRYTFCHNQQNS